MSRYMKIFQNFNLNFDPLYDIIFYVDFFAQEADYENRF